MAAWPHRSSRPRRSCAGCLLHHPCTLSLTLVALVLWLGQFVRAAVAVAAAQPPALGPLIGTTLLLVLAQGGPRFAPVLWRRWRRFRAGSA